MEETRECLYWPGKNVGEGRDRIQSLTTTSIKCFQAIYKTGLLF